MAKPRTRFVCQNCGSSQPKWMGKCPDCGEWNSLVETVVERPKTSVALPLVSTSQPQPLPTISAD